jgi:hypothetical protein
MQADLCLHCGTRVVPTKEGNCPSCQRSFHEIPANVDPQQIQQRIDAEAAKLCQALAEALSTSYCGPRVVRLSAENGVVIDFGCEDGCFRVTFTGERINVVPIDFPGCTPLQETPIMTTDIPEGLPALKACGAPRPQTSKPAGRRSWWKFW